MQKYICNTYICTYRYTKRDLFMYPPIPHSHDFPWVTSAGGLPPAQALMVPPDLSSSRSPLIYFLFVTCKTYGFYQLIGDGAIVYKPQDLAQVLSYATCTCLACSIVMYLYIYSIDVFIHIYIYVLPIAYHLFHYISGPLASSREEADHRGSRPQRQQQLTLSQEE